MQEYDKPVRKIKQYKSSKEEPMKHEMKQCKQAQYRWTDKDRETIQTRPSKN